LVDNLLAIHLQGKDKGKGLGTCYSTAYMSRLEQQRFTISEVAADWYELMIPWRIIQPSIGPAVQHTDIPPSHQPH